METFIKFFIAAVAVFSIVFVVLRFTTVSQGPRSESANRKVRVVASLYPLYFFAHEVGGDKITVHDITPAGAEPHDYEPTPQDIVKIDNADVLILNGGLEAWGDDVRKNLQRTDVRVVVAGEGLFNRVSDGEGKTISDPHVWLDPVLAQKEVSVIADAFVAVDPQDTSSYRNNEQSLLGTLRALDEEYRTGLSHCRQSDIVTSHAAFGYLASRYGFHQVSIAGFSPDQEPSPQQIAQVADFARSKNIRYIFFESLVSPRLSETVAGEIGAVTLALNPLEGLSDARIAAGEDYFSVMRTNLANLKTALQCN